MRVFAVALVFFNADRAPVAQPAAAYLLYGVPFFGGGSFFRYLTRRLVYPSILERITNSTDQQ